MTAKERDDLFQVVIVLIIGLVLGPAMGFIPSLLLVAILLTEDLWICLAQTDNFFLFSDRKAISCASTSVIWHTVAGRG